MPSQIKSVYGFRASCETCDWTSEMLPSVEEARRAGEDHDQEAHRYGDICRWCGMGSAPIKAGIGCTRRPGGHDLVRVDLEHVGPIGPGTPEGRMREFWSALEAHDHLLVSRYGLNPFSSKADGMSERAVLRALESIPSLLGRIEVARNCLMQCEANMVGGMDPMPYYKRALEVLNDEVSA